MNLFQRYVLSIVETGAWRSEIEDQVRMGYEMRSCLEGKQTKQQWEKEKEEEGRRDLYFGIYSSVRNLGFIFK